MVESEQLMLPVEIRPDQKVYWFNAVQSHRWGLLGRRAVTRVAMLDNLRPAVTEIEVKDIPNLTDPSLRYALRFAAAADAIGFVQDSAYSSHSNCVFVDATDEGMDSRFLGATYTGVVTDGKDTFLEDILSCEPKD